MRYWIGLTDRDWYEYLASLERPSEVNFWQPSPTRPVRLDDGAPFLFKLRKRHGGAVVGGGFFVHFTVLPATVAWDVFADSNGAPSFQEMAHRIKRYRSDFDVHADSVGCMVLTEPFFLPQHLWVSAPTDWPTNVQRGKQYETESGPGALTWQHIQAAMASDQAGHTVRDEDRGSPSYGAPTQFIPRLGQGAFRARVIDAYERRCAVSGERTLPVLQAAHIKPFSRSGPHATENGLLLRSDLHTLFDRGYVTVSPNYELRVSGKIREEFENGRDYYALDGQAIRLPKAPAPAPSRELLEWHGDVIYRG